MLSNRKSNIKKYYIVKLNKLLIIIMLMIFYDIMLGTNYFSLNFNNLLINKKLDFNNKIKLAFYSPSIKNGGIERITATLLNYLGNSNIFNLYLFTKKDKENDEFFIPKKIKRKVIKTNEKLIRVLNEEKIDILIYNFFNREGIQILNNIKSIKTIFYIHQSIFLWIYMKCYNNINTYKFYQSSKYVISLVPFENDYLFKNWGINSILMDNFITYDYNSIIPSDLSSKTILMIGRGIDLIKRFDLGIKTMKYIVKEIPESIMVVISSFIENNPINNLIKELNIQKNIKLVGYVSNPEIYFKNSSLHILPSISESFGLAVAETKIYGIPNIILGINYISTSKGGTIILYDDNPVIIAKEVIKILKNDKYRKKLGKEARKSMIKFNNKLLIKRWIKLIISVYNGDNYYNQLRQKDKKLPKNEALKILNTQIKLLKNRIKSFKNFTAQNLLNFSFMMNLKDNLK